MIPIRRLATLVLPLLLLLPLTMGSSRAQTTNADPRYAFADTTLVRDTLGLTFDRLFPLADSLRMQAVDLRALSVRYQLTLYRLIKLTDSLGVPIDSVGPVMERERFNVLMRSGRSSNDFTYNSTYSVRNGGNTWQNIADTHFYRGAAYLGNNITETFSTNAGRKQVDRTATTQIGWNRSKRLSAGVLTAFNRTNTPGDRSIYSLDTGSDAYSLTLDSQQKPMSGLSSRVHFEGGLTANNDGSQQKHGGSAKLSGDTRYMRGKWLNNFVSWSATRDLSDLALEAGSDTIPGPVTLRNSVKSSSVLNGTLALWTSAPVGFNATYNLTSGINPRASTLDTLRNSAGRPVREFFTEVRDPYRNNNLNSTLRMQLDSDHSLDVSGVLGSQVNSLPSQQSKNLSLQKRTTSSRFSTDARYSLGPSLRLKHSFGLSHVDTDTPDNLLRGRLLENTENRSMSGEIDWDLRRGVQAVLKADISLNRYRTEQIGTYTTSNSPNDTYSQSIEARIGFPILGGGSSNTGLKVGRGQKVNLTANSAANNTETRSYNADWTWNCRLMERLTVRQTDQLGAIYTVFPYIPTRNQLSLTYNINTTLVATLSTRLTVELGQSARSMENGGYLPLAPQDPNDYFSKTRNDVTRSLTATVTYALNSQLSLNFKPDYSSQAVAQNSTGNGTLVPYSQTRRLNFNGGASMNLRVGSKGTLRGDLNRQSNQSRTLQYSSTSLATAPAVIQDYWSGSLTFVWTL